jgi:fatty acid desaturase
MGFCKGEKMKNNKYTRAYTKKETLDLLFGLFFQACVIFFLLSLYFYNYYQDYTSAVGFFLASVLLFVPFILITFFQVFIPLVYYSLKKMKVVK